MNPDAGSISSLDPVGLLKTEEIVVGIEPWALAIAPDGNHVYVVDRAAGTLVVVQTQTASIQATISVGPEPGGVALSPSGDIAYVTAAHALVVVSTTARSVSSRIHLASQPYAIAVSNDGDDGDDDERIYVTTFLALAKPGADAVADDGRTGQITVFDAHTFSKVAEITLPPDAHGFPNQLASIALSNQRAWVPMVQAAPALPNDLTTKLFAAVASLDLATAREDLGARLALNDQDTFGSPVNNPVAAIPSPDGRTLYVVLGGSDLVEVVDVSRPHDPRLVKFLATGANPRGIALSLDGQRGYVMSYLSRSVTVLDFAKLEAVADIRVAAETLPSDVLRGKVLFNTAADPRMARVSWVSCASCHTDGGTDGVTWMFPDGPRQTPPLWNAGQTLPWHWSAALDEPQDVEDSIQTIQLGIGLAPGADPPLLGAANSRRSADLDALAAYLRRGIRTPAAEQPVGDVASGRSLFVSKGCVACHGGATWTISALPAAVGSMDADGNRMIDAALRDVGTATQRDVRGRTGFDVPSLLDIGLTAPYLHDGSLPTLTALLASGHLHPGEQAQLGASEIDALVVFLLSIGPDTTPIAADTKP